MLLASHVVSSFMKHYSSSFFLGVDTYEGHQQKKAPMHGHFMVWLPVSPLVKTNVHESVMKFTTSIKYTCRTYGGYEYAAD